MRRLSPGAARRAAAGTHRKQYPAPCRAQRSSGAGGFQGAVVRVVPEHGAGVQRRRRGRSRPRASLSYREHPTLAARCNIGIPTLILFRAGQARPASGRSITSADRLWATPERAAFPAPIKAPLAGRWYNAARYYFAFFASGHFASLPSTFTVSPSLLVLAPWPGPRRPSRHQDGVVTPDRGQGQDAHQDLLHVRCSLKLLLNLMRGRKDRAPLTLK